MVRNGPKSPQQFKMDPNGPKWYQTIPNHLKLSKKNVICLAAICSLLSNIEDIFFVIKLSK